MRKDATKLSPGGGADELGKACHGPRDMSEFDEISDLGEPGGYPFTRGAYPGMYRDRHWTIRQYSGYATARESNRRYRYLLSQGNRGLSVAFDLPTQLGLDSDHPLAEGEVGRAGVAIDGLWDMGTLFREIDLGRVSTSMTINATAPILLALYLVQARRQGTSWRAVRGTVQNDILKEYIARGTYLYPVEASLRLVTDLVAFCHEAAPGWNPISISGYHIREAGSTAAQEIGFTLANAETYVESVLKAGLHIDDFAPRLSFFFAAHNDLFEEVAKFRAARRLWARCVKERWGARNPKSCMMRFHTQTGGSTLTAQQPDNNVVRTTVQALAAVLGGTQSLHTNGKDEAMSLPTEAAAELALRTQQILAHESGLTEAVDPLGGSWYLEKLTNRLEEESESYLERIRSMGGMVPAIESGFIQREIQDSAHRLQRTLESGERVVVGVNRFQDEDPVDIELLRVDPETRERQMVELSRHRAGRNRDRWRRSMEKLSRTARGRENLMAAIVEGVEAGATVGEMSEAMGDVFGEYREQVVL